MSCIIVSVCSTLLVAMNHYDAVHILIIINIQVCVCVRLYNHTRAHVNIHAGVSHRDYVHAYTQTGHSSRRRKHNVKYTLSQPVFSYEPLLPSIIRRTHSAVAFFLRSLLFSVLFFVSFLFSSISIRLQASAFETASFYVCNSIVT